MKGKVGEQWNKTFMEIFRSMSCVFLLVSPVCYENFLNKVNLQRYVGNSFEPSIVAVAVGFFLFCFQRCPHNIHILVKRECYYSKHTWFPIVFVTGDVRRFVQGFQ